MDDQATDTRSVTPFSSAPLRREMGLLILLMVMGLGLRLYLAWQPGYTLLGRETSDDAFYYLTIARNIARGNGATFDGIAPTNGFHPLYTAMLVPLFWIFPHNTDLNVHLALTLLSLSSVLTTLPLYLMLRRTTSYTATVIACAIWLFNPWAISIPLKGVESAVYVLIAATAMSYYLAHRSHPQPRHFAGLGFLLGLTTLARSDGVFLTLAILTDQVWLYRSQRSRAQEVMRPLAALVGATSLTLLPWLLWNYDTFGTLIQVSGQAVFFHTHFETRSLDQVVGTMFTSTGVTLFISLYLAAPALFVILFALGMRLVRPSAAKLTVSPFGFLALYIGLILGFYAWYLWNYQFWYFAPIILGVSLFSGVFFHQFEKGLKRQRNALLGLTFLAVVAMLALTWGIWWTSPVGKYPAQQNGYRIAQWLSENTDATDKIGAWNSGIIGYYANRTVVNLDGVVNNDLLGYAQDRDLPIHNPLALREYLDDNGINIITDYEPAMQELLEEYAPQFLQRMHSFPDVTGEYTVSIYRLLP